MPYAIMQRELTAPAVDQLKQAFRVLPTLRELDAHTAAHDAFGILLRGLDVEDASALHDALLKQGVETEVIEESELPVMPPAKVIKQMDFLPAHLVMYDPMGRSFALPWREIMLIAAGDVRLPEFRKARAPEPASLAGAAANHPANEARSRDAAQFHLVLELVLAGGISRYSVVADEFGFDYLGGRLTKSLARNFALLVQDLTEFAPHAGLNRGAYLLCENADMVFAYPSKAAFFEEILWLLWRIRRAAAGG